VVNPFGAVFGYRGNLYRKIAMSMAQEMARPDGRNWGQIMVGNVWVRSDGPFLPAEVAAEWKPDWGHWEPAVVGRDLEARELGGA
jgi:hypothetical protein